MTAANRPDAPATRLQSVALLGTLLVAFSLGIWSYFWPLEFYERFPVVLGEWISTDGPFNEHLVRDHGAQYLALGAAGVYALGHRTQSVLRALGIAWVTFGVLHFAYHATHLGHLDPLSAGAQLSALAITMLLGVGLLGVGGTVPRAGRGRTGRRVTSATSAS